MLSARTKINQGVVETDRPIYFISLIIAVNTYSIWRLEISSVHIKKCVNNEVNEEGKESREKL